MLVATFDKDLCSIVADRINITPVNLIDLLPIFKQGFAYPGIFFSLNFLDQHLAVNPTINYHNTLNPKFGPLQNNIRFETLNEEDMLASSLKVLFQNKLLTKENHTIYHVARLVVHEKDSNWRKLMYYSEKFLIEQISNTLVHPKVDPLLLSTILNKPELVTKYLDDSRSNKINTYKECVEISPKCCEIIKGKLIRKIFLLGQIFHKDLSHYVLANGML